MMQKNFANVAGLLILAMLALGAGRVADAVEEVDPILRLDLPGHTGEVRAVAFTGDSQRLISGGRDKVALVWTLEGIEPAGPAEAAGERTTRDIARGRAMERARRLWLKA